MNVSDPQSQLGLIGRVAQSLLDRDYYEVEAALRSAGSSGTPAGWRNFSTPMKLRTLRVALQEISKAELNSLAKDVLWDENLNRSESEEASSTQSGDDKLQSKFNLSSSAPAARIPLSSRPEIDSPGKTVDSTSPIFVVHGRNTRAEAEVARILERTTGRDALVIHEQAGAGRTIVEQIEHHGSAAAYAVVLLTADDHGGIIGAPTQPRARQNVILELGYFWGKIGRERVAVLVEEGLERPSDTDGIHYIAMDAGGSWRLKLLRELQAAEITVDYNKLPS